MPRRTESIYSINHKGQIHLYFGNITEIMGKVNEGSWDLKKG